MSETTPDKAIQLLTSLLRQSGRSASFMEDCLTTAACHCQNLMAQPSFDKLSKDIQFQIFTAISLLSYGIHDIVEKQTQPTVLSRKMALSISCKTRYLLWKFGHFSGDEGTQQFRENVCAFIRHASLPFLLGRFQSPIRDILDASADSRWLNGFTLESLFLLSSAMQSPSQQEDKMKWDEKLTFFKQQSMELSCWTGSFPFHDRHSQRAWYSGHLHHPQDIATDDTWGDIIMMCGLPGTGKDTWIHDTHPNHPVISLDGIRSELHISPTDDQTAVIITAFQRANDMLTLHRPFIWNATSLLQRYRRQFIRLCEQAGASVRIVFLETTWENELQRNRNRSAMVPESVIDSMLMHFVPPSDSEAKTIERLFT